MAPFQRYICAFELFGASVPVEVDNCGLDSGSAFIDSRFQGRLLCGAADCGQAGLCDPPGLVGVLLAYMRGHFLHHDHHEPGADAAAFDGPYEVADQVHAAGDRGHFPGEAFY